MIEQIAAGFLVVGPVVALTVILVGVVALCVYTIDKMWHRCRTLALSAAVALFVIAFLGLCYAVGYAAGV